MMRKIFFCCMLCCLMPLMAMAQGEIHERSTVYEAPKDAQVVTKLKRWQDLKFGVLMHWGLYSVPGIVESWSICDEDWITRDTTCTYQEYKDWYWGLCNAFNPTQFAPTQWAGIMQRAGMKYMIFTTKHHDGFCMFDSKYTNFSIAKHSFKAHPKRDVLKHVLAAFRAKGFMIGEYFSKPDWHSQDYWWDVYPTKRGRNVNYDVKQWPWRWQRYKQFVHNQLEELLTGYGAVDILWLDGGWVNKDNNQDIDMPAIAKMGRAHQPGLIMVDRTIHGEFENYQTPERSIPDVQLNYPWESCITLSNDWGWVPNPTWKSAQTVVNILAEIVAKGGNLVLGVGPTPQGLIEPAAEKRLNEIGQWLNRYGKAIYNTATTPKYNDGQLWFTASKDGRQRYAIYTLKDNEAVPATLQWQGNVPKSVQMLGTGQRLKMQKRGDNVTVTLPKPLKNEPFALQLNM